MSYGIVHTRKPSVPIHLARHIVLIVSETEHKEYRVGDVQDVDDTVQDCHHGDRHQFILGTDSVMADIVYSSLQSIQWPHHHGCYVHRCCQDVIADHKHVEGEGEIRCQLCNSEHDYEDDEDEAQGVHRHTPPPSGGVILVCLQRYEYDAGEECFQQFHYPGWRREKPAGLPARSEASYGHFSCVGYETEPGQHSDADGPGPV